MVCAETDKISNSLSKELITCGRIDNVINKVYVEMDNGLC